MHYSFSLSNKERTIITSKKGGSNVNKGALGLQMLLESVATGVIYSTLAKTGKVVANCCVEIRDPLVVAVSVGW